MLQFEDGDEGAMLKTKVVGDEKAMLQAKNRVMPEVDGVVLMLGDGTKLQAGDRVMPEVVIGPSYKLEMKLQYARSGEMGAGAW